MSKKILILHVLFYIQSLPNNTLIDGKNIHNSFSPSQKHVLSDDAQSLHELSAQLSCANNNLSIVCSDLEKALKTYHDEAILLDVGTFARKKRFLLNRRKKLQTQIDKAFADIINSQTDKQVATWVRDQLTAACPMPKNIKTNPSVMVDVSDYLQMDLYERFLFLSQGHELSDLCENMLAKYLQMSQLLPSLAQEYNANLNSITAILRRTNMLMSQRNVLGVLKKRVKMLKDLSSYAKKHNIPVSTFVEKQYEESMASAGNSYDKFDDNSYINSSDRCNNPNTSDYMQGAYRVNNVRNAYANSSNSSYTTNANDSDYIQHKTGAYRVNNVRNSYVANANNSDHTQHKTGAYMVNNVRNSYINSSDRCNNPYATNPNTSDYMQYTNGAYRTNNVRNSYVANANNSDHTQHKTGAYGTNNARNPYTTNSNRANSSYTSSVNNSDHTPYTNIFEMVSRVMNKSNITHSDRANIASSDNANATASFTRTGDTRDNSHIASSDNANMSKYRDYIFHTTSSDNPLYARFTSNNKKLDMSNVVDYNSFMHFVTKQFYEAGETSAKESARARANAKERANARYSANAARDTKNVSNRHVANVGYFEVIYNGKTRIFYGTSNVGLGFFENMFSGFSSLLDSMSLDNEYIIPNGVHANKIAQAQRKKEQSSLEASELLSKQKTAYINEKINQLNDVCLPELLKLENDLMATLTSYMKQIPALNINKAFQIKDYLSLEQWSAFDLTGCIDKINQAGVSFKTNWAKQNDKVQQLLKEIEQFVDAKIISNFKKDIADNFSQVEQSVDLIKKLVHIILIKNSQSVNFSDLLQALNPANLRQNAELINQCYSEKLGLEFSFSKVAIEFILQYANFFKENDLDKNSVLVWKQFITTITPIYNQLVSYAKWLDVKNDDLEFLNNKVIKTFFPYLSKYTKDFLHSENLYNAKLPDFVLDPSWLVEINAILDNIDQYYFERKYADKNYLIEEIDDNVNVNEVNDVVI